MKIDGNRSAHDLDPTKSAEAAQKAAEQRAARKSEVPGSASKDTVQVSSDAQLLSAALKATTDAPAIRQDKVEAARQKLAAGEIGNDAGRLADRMIDDLLKE